MVFPRIIAAEIYHGQPTFEGTRIFVSDVLADVARGMDWDAIIKRWHGTIAREAIAEAVELAGEALVSHSGALVREAAL